MAAARANGDDDFPMRFSAYLSDYIDSFFTDCPVQKDMRECTQKVHEILEEIQVELDLPYTMIYTGSSTDGLQTKSDIDVMYCFKHFIVVEKPSQIPSDFKNGVLLLDTAKCFPCYTRLKLHRPHPDPDLMELFIYVDGEYYLGNENYVKFTKPIFEQYIPDEVHGPAVMVAGDAESGRPDIDYVTCIGCPFWPSQARNFLDPDYPILGGLDPDMFSSFHVVPMAHKKSARPDIEFRMSFSVAEKKLAHSWTTKQMKCFAVCKDIVKEYICLGQEPLCSYHIKTLMFWMIDWCYLDEDFWDQRDIYSLVIEFVHNVLFDSINKKFLRHYFVPTNNLLDGFEDRDFQMYMYAFHRNFQSLPETVEEKRKKEHSIDEQIEDIVNVRITEVLHFFRRLSQFQTVSSFLYTEHRFITAERFEKAVKSVTAKHGKSPVGDLIHIKRLRCQAIFRMHDALDNEEVGPVERTKLLKEAESEFFVSLDFSNDLMVTEFNLTGYTYLAWFYYFTDDKEKCADFLFKGVEAFHKCKKHYKLISKEFIIPAGKTQAYPNYLKEDIIRIVHLLVSRSEPLYLDPVAVLSFLYFRLFGTKKLVDESIKGRIEARAQLHSYSLLSLAGLRYGHADSEFDIMHNRTDEEVANELRKMFAKRRALTSDDKPKEPTFFQKVMDIIRSQETPIEEKREFLQIIFPTTDFGEAETQEDIYELIECHENAVKLFRMLNLR